jgi:hypothetical protein
LLRISTNDDVMWRGWKLMEMEEVTSEWFTAKIPADDGWLTTSWLPSSSFRRTIYTSSRLDVTSHPVQQFIISIGKQRNLKMKENYTQLYPNEQVATAVGDYAYEHSTKLPKHITDHHAWGSETQEKANYMISPFQAQFHVWIAKAVGARRST